MGSRAEQDINGVIKIVLLRSRSVAKALVAITAGTVQPKPKSIGRNAFHGCHGFTNLTIPQGVRNISTEIFFGCKNLTTVTLPTGINNIEDAAFAYCLALTDINYNGTIQQWNAINKNLHWFIGQKNFTIHCTDGDITDVNS